MGGILRGAAVGLASFAAGFVVLALALPPERPAPVAPRPPSLVVGPGAMAVAPDPTPGHERPVPGPEGADPGHDPVAGSAVPGNRLAGDQGAGTTAEPLRLPPGAMVLTLSRALADPALPVPGVARPAPRPVDPGLAGASRPVPEAAAGPAVAGAPAVAVWQRLGATLRLARAELGNRRPATDIAMALPFGIDDSTDDPAPLGPPGVGNAAIPSATEPDPATPATRSLPDLATPAAPALAPPAEPDAPAVDPPLAADEPVPPLAEATAPHDHTPALAGDPPGPADEPVPPLAEAPAPPEDTLVLADDPPGPADDPVPPLAEAPAPPEDTPVLAGDPPVPADEPVPLLAEATTPPEDPIALADDPPRPVDEPVPPLAEATAPQDDPVALADDPPRPADEPVPPLAEAPAQPDDTPALTGDPPGPADEPVPPLAEATAPHDHTPALAGDPPGPAFGARVVGTGVVAGRGGADRFFAGAVDATAPGGQLVLAADNGDDGSGEDGAGDQGALDPPQPETDPRTPEADPPRPRLLEPGRSVPGVRIDRLPQVGTPPEPRAPPPEPRAEADPAPDDPPRWRSLAVQVATDERPPIALILFDTAEDDATEAAILALSIPATVALPPFAPDAPRRAAAYVAAGHEVVLSIAEVPALATAGDLEVLFAAWLTEFPALLGVLDPPSGDARRERQLAPALSALLSDLGLALIAPERGLSPMLGAARTAGVPALGLYRELGSADEGPVALARMLDRIAFEAGRLGRLAVLWHMQDPQARAALAGWLDGTLPGSRGDRVQPVTAGTALILDTTP